MSEDYSLKPCPFCGGKVDYACNLDNMPHGVHCHACKYVLSFANIKKLKPHERFGVAMSQIAEQWNRRLDV